jgi:hypothetical protein
MNFDTIFESCDATFFENIFSMKDMRNNVKFSTETAPDNTIPMKSPVESFKQTLEKDDNEVYVRNKRQRIAKSFGDDFIVYLMGDTPTSIIEAYASPDADDWKKQFILRWTRFFLMELGSYLNYHSVVNQLVVSGCSKRSLGLMVLLTSTWLDRWLKVILKRKANISLILIHLLLE